VWSFKNPLTDGNDRATPTHVSRKLAVAVRVEKEGGECLS